MSNSCRLPHITSQTFESAKQMTFSSLAAWQTDCFSLLTLHPNHAHCSLPIAHCPLHIAHCTLSISYCLLPFAHAHCLVSIGHCEHLDNGIFCHVHNLRKDMFNLYFLAHSFMESAIHFYNWSFARCSMTVQPYPCIMAQLMNMWVTHSFSSLPSFHHLVQFPS